ncbi:hypothetical protein [Bradyrhizobium sp. CB2312]|uniref:hypothetical protein n=1 Tax=Bradyrhizobium sp. CB2312 TaxID=3039155 RepID=UPI0024B115D7|nr:hypothetical protein [Bradyrhizobium sp. CB2312]WFU71467.1 hypothetical protein QA642_40910 [Bradyrhizobium sp. CB2312]
MATYFWLEDERLEKLVAGMGRARMLEVAVPVEKTNQWLSAGRAVVGAFARTLGCRLDHGAFDLYTMEPLGAAAIFAVHTAGETTFKRVGRGYSAGYRSIR